MVKKPPSITDLFEWEYQWTKGASGRNSLNEPVETYSKAICWCLAGRIEHMFGIKGLSNQSPIVQTIVGVIRSVFPERVTFNSDLVFDIIAFNDDPRTIFDDVQVVLRVANRNLAREKVTA